MEGFIKLHRQLLEWEWYDDINTKVLFIHLLLKANHAEGKWRGNIIQRGELITSLGKLSEETGLSVRQVRTCINKLKTTNEVTSSGQATFTIIKLNNYNLYQSSDKQYDTPKTKQGQSNDKEATTNNNKKNNKNENNKKKYGEFKHVLLTDNEKEKLIKEYGEEKFFSYIKKLDEGIEMKGYKYKNHNLALRNWIRSDGSKKNEGKKSFEKDSDVDWTAGL